MLTENGRGIIAPYIPAVFDTSGVDDLFAPLRETTANPRVKEICKEDPLIRAYAKSRLERLGTEEEQRVKDMNLIRYRCRVLARLLTQLNLSTFQWKSLDEFITAPKFDDVIAATRALSLACDSPKLACNIGHFISQCAEQKTSLAIRSKDTEKRQDAKDFMDLFSVEWNNKITSIANRRMALQKLNKPVIMPITQDMVTLSEWLSTEMTSISNVQCPSPGQCKRMANLLLVKILIFNKRRIAEVQELLVEDYRKRSTKEDISEEVINSLNISEKTLAKR